MSDAAHSDSSARASPATSFKLQSFIVEEHELHGACAVRSEDERLLNVGSFGGATKEPSERVLRGCDLFVRLMERGPLVFGADDDDEVIREQRRGAFEGRSGDVPNRTVLDDDEPATEHADL